MSVEESVARAFEVFKNSAQNERLAHAYLITGNPSGGAGQFAQQVASYLMCTSESDRPCGSCSGCHRVADGSHSDLFRVEPEKKSRIISIEAMRVLIRKMQQSSFEGGWKIGMISYADRLNKNSANAFLKTLEEPPKQSLLLLLTDSPQALLPTIISRCQRIAITEDGDKVDCDWTDWLDDILATDQLSDPVTQAVLAHRLEAMLVDQKEKILEAEKAVNKASDEKSEVLDARVEAKLKQVRTEIFRSIMLWQRDVLLLVNGCDESLIFHQNGLESLRKTAADLDVSKAMKRVRAVEEMIDRLDRVSKPVIPVLESGFALMG